MAGLKDADDFRDGEQFKGASFLKLLFLGGGVLFLIIFFVLAFSGKEAAEGEVPRIASMAYSWLFAVILFATLCIGGIFWTLLHHASNSGWGTVIRRSMENLGSAIPLVLALGLPLILIEDFRNNLWEWIPEKAAIEDYFEKDLDAKIAEKKEAIEAKQSGAQAEFEAFKAENEAAKNGATPGQLNFLAEALAAEQEQLNTVLAHDVTESELKKEIRKEVFLDHHHGNVLLWKKDGYLDLGTWYFRYALYAIALVGIIYTLRFWSVKNDTDSDPKYFLWQRRAACGFLPFFAASWTFLVFDWLMALDYTWFSTMWGVYLFAGCAQSSMAFLILLITGLRKKGYLENVVTREHYHLMGKLLLAFTIFWAYIAFSQFFLIWYANITEETRFYLQRNTEFWNTYTITFLVAGHFFIPFGALLIQQTKKNTKYICSVCCWVLAMHILDIYWIIIPERGPSLTGGEAMIVPGAIWFDVLAFLAVGCLFGWFILWRLGTASLFPSRDPRLDESLNVVN